MRNIWFVCCAILKQILACEKIQAGCEIVAHGSWYDFESKYTEGGMELRVPAPD